jgi:hypothetical protein
MNLDQIKNNAKKHFYVWVGQNATTGAPNRLTGHLSFYGDFIAFKTKQQRDEYFDNWRRVNPSERCFKCTANTGRQFKLGMSVYDYWCHLHLVISITETAA